jgi:DNA polymerase-3 subunit gamma/tau
MSSYQVIARKYRPQRFEDVIGQEHVTRTLANAITAGRIAHAYLFCGPRGTGKTTVARIFAKALNCTGGPKVDFDDADPRVQEITDGRSLDVMEIDGASNNGVEQVRELRETCKFAPASSKFKIYIIDEVHMLSTAAFNALLKTLEEPPAHVKFLFATTDPQKVLPTILSRCQRFDLRRIPTPLIAQHLSDIAGKEGVTIDKEALYAVARAAEGGMRDGESTLDQLISFCGNDIAEADVLSMFGLTAQGQILAVVRAVLDGNADAALRELNQLAHQGKDLGRLLTDLLGLFRNLLIYQVSKGDLSLLEVSDTEAAALQENAGLISSDGMTRVLEIMTDAEGRFRDAVSKKILLEVTLIKAIEGRTAISLDAVLKQLNALRQEAAAGGTTVPNLNPNLSLNPPVPATPRPTPGAESAKTAPKIAVAPAPAAPPPAAAVAPAPPPPRSPAPPPAAAAPANMDEVWSKLMGALSGPKFVFLKTYLQSAFPVSLTDRLLSIGFPAAFAANLPMADNPTNHRNLQATLQELGLSGLQVKFVQADPPEGWAPVMAPITEEPPPFDPDPTPGGASRPQPSRPSAPTAAAAPASVLTKEDFKNDPLIQKALEVFKGEIVGIQAG